jgi:hypothetical protein
VKQDGKLTVMTHDPSAFDRAPRLLVDTIPMATIADSIPGYEMSDQMSVALLSDDRLAVALYSSILLFDGRGNPEKKFGDKPGKGPNEFAFNDGILRADGDTFIVPDHGNSRVSWITVGQGLARSAPLPEVKDVTMYTGVVGMLPGERLVLHSFGTHVITVPDQIVRPRAPLVLLDLKNRRGRTVDSIPEAEWTAVMLKIGDQPASKAGLAVRFGRRTYLAVWDTSIVVATGEGYSIDLRNATGAVTGRLRSARLRRPVTQEMRAAAFVHDSTEMSANPITGPNADATFREFVRMHRDVLTADSLPPYQGVFATPKGRLWVVDPIAPGDTFWTATAFRRDGAMLGRLTAPGTDPPILITDDRIVTRRKDDEGGTWLRVYRITSPLQ